MKEGRYEAGVSNITPKQAKRYRRIGWLFVGVMVLFGIVHFALNLPQVLMLLIAIPAFIASMRLMEARQKFSVTYGLHGLYDEGEGVRHTVENEEYNLDDVSRAQSILFFATGAAMLIAIGAFVVLV